MGQNRTWNAAPANFVDPTQNDWATWVTQALTSLAAPLFPPPTPTVTTVSHPGAVLVAWNEVGAGTTSYALYENATAAAAPGIPFATAPANIGAASNAILRSGLNDTTTRYYTVVAIAPNARSNPSIPAPGAALSTVATVIPVSQTPLNQGGVGGGVGGGGAIVGINKRINQL